MRRQSEIVPYYQSIEDNDFLGFKREVLLRYVTYEQARPLLKPDAKPEEWFEPTPLSRETVLEEMRSYMEFAWDKVCNHRGISANRSVEKMAMWLWLLEDHDLQRFAEDDDHYAMYGAPILAAVCKKYGFPIPEGEDIERMSKGLSCHDDCEGCHG